MNIILVDYATWSSMQAAITRIDNNTILIVNKLATMETKMSALSDKVAQVQQTFATLAQEITDNAAASKAEMDALVAAIAASGGTSPDVQTAVDNLNALNDTMTAAAVTLKATTDSLTASLPHA